MVRVVLPQEAPLRAVTVLSEKHPVVAWGLSEPTRPVLFTVVEALTLPARNFVLWNYLQGGIGEVEDARVVCSPANL
jgi:hypothetical protein